MPPTALPPSTSTTAATDRGGAIAPLDDAGAATGALMPTSAALLLERNSGSAQRVFDGSTEATLVCSVTHHCGMWRRGTPLMHLQLPHHMNDAGDRRSHLHGQPVLGTNQEEYARSHHRRTRATEVGKRVGAAHGEYELLLRSPFVSFVSLRTRDQLSDRQRSR